MKINTILSSTHLCIGVTYENILTNAKTTYVDPKLAEYEKMIDKYNVNYTVSGSVTVNLDQQRKVVMVLHILMKEYNNTLTKSLCLTLSTDDMSAYTHLVQLDFIKDWSSPSSDHWHV